MRGNPLLGDAPGFVEPQDGTDSRARCQVFARHLEQMRTNRIDAVVAVERRIALGRGGARAGPVPGPRTIATATIRLRVTIGPGAMVRNSS